MNPNIKYIDMGGFVSCRQKPLVVTSPTNLGGGRDTTYDYYVDYLDPIPENNIIKNCNMALKKQLITNTNVNQNGWRFSEEALESLKDQINNSDRSMLGVVGYPISTTLDLHKVSHSISNAVIENGSLYADIHVLDVESGESLKSILNECVFRTFTTIDENINPRVVNHPYLVSVVAILKDEDALTLN